MIKLHPSRFAAIVCQKLPNRVLLINPALLPLIKKIPLIPAPEPKNTLYEKILCAKNEKSTQETSDEVEHLEELILTPARQTFFKDQSEHQNFFRDKWMALGELFDSSWKSKHVGSARNLVLNDIQLKGVGLVLPVAETTYEDAGGTLSTTHAIKAFLYSHLMDTTHPIGCARAIGVCQLKERKDLSVLVREYSVVRLTSVGPEMDAEEKLSIQFYLKKKFPDSTPDQILRNICAAQAATACLGGTGNSTPDNLLIDGSAIDEEAWSWPKESGAVRLFADFEAPEYNSSVTVDNFDWEKAVLNYDSWIVYEHSLKNFLKAYKYIYGGEIKSTYEELQEHFLQHLNSLSDGRTGPWELPPRGNFKDWIEKLRKMGCSLSLETLPEIGHFSLIINWRPTIQSHSTLAAEVEKIVYKCEKLAAEEGAIDPFRISNTLLEVAGRAGLVMRTRPDKTGNPVPNVMSLKDYWNSSLEKWPLLSGEFLLVVKSDKGELELKKKDELKEFDVTPLFFRGVVSGQEVIIPADKVIIHGK